VKTLLLDAGHGGEDSGASFKEALEKEITLNIVLEMEKIISKRFSECEIIQTRNVDEFLSVPDRLKKIRDIKPDAFISIHCNAVVDYPYTKIDEREIIQGWEVFYRDEYDFPLARAIGKTLGKSSLWEKSRGVKQDVEFLGKRVMVLNDLKTSGCLVEIGFLTHPYERQMILNNVFGLAELISAGTLEFFGVIHE
jgi:N-acetylmuramoyl-L-alanine amidase